MKDENKKARLFPCSINFHVTEKQKEKLTALAATNSVSISQYLRMLIEKQGE